MSQLDLFTHMGVLLYESASIRKHKKTAGMCKENYRTSSWISMLALYFPLADDLHLFKLCVQVIACYASKVGSL